MDIKTLFQGEGEIFLNCGCGPYTDTALEISAGYRRNACVDISERALEICRHKLGPKGLYLCGSMVGLALPEGISDGTLCEHVLYHVDKFEQERAVRELIRVTKPGAPILIIYSNPLSPLNVIENTLRLMGITKLLGGNRLYFFRWRLKWWRRFGDVCDVEIRPFDPISARQENILLRSDNVARIFFRFCRWLEAEWPHLAVRIWSYPMIVLTKRPYASRSNEDRIEVDAKVDLQG
jgi:SAM-dependent methyltransferase